MLELLGKIAGMSQHGSISSHDETRRMQQCLDVIAKLINCQPHPTSGILAVPPSKPFAKAFRLVMRFISQRSVRALLVITDSKNANDIRSFGWNVARIKSSFFYYELIASSSSQRSLYRWLEHQHTNNCQSFNLRSPRCQQQTRGQRSTAKISIPKIRFFCRRTMLDDLLIRRAHRK